MQRADFVDALRQDMHFALRQFRRAPGVAFLALFTLALGIGATTAIFTLLYHVVLRPFPFAHPERVVYVAERYQGSNGNMSIGNYVDVARQSRSFDAMGAMILAPFNLAEGNEAARVLGARTTASMFPVLGVAPAIGRVFSVDEDAPGNDGVVVLSHALWQTRFGGDTSVLGRLARRQPPGASSLTRTPLAARFSAAMARPPIREPRRLRESLAMCDRGDSAPTWSRSSISPSRKHQSRRGTGFSARSRWSAAGQTATERHSWQRCAVQYAGLTPTSRSTASRPWTMRCGGRRRPLVSTPFS